MSTTARAKRELAIYGGIIGLVLIVAGIASLGGAYHVYTNPPMEEIPPEEYDVQEFSTDLEHSAEVTGETPLYEEGETLRNKPVYFTNATPELDLSIAVDVPDDREVEITHRLVIHHEATFDGTVFWEQQRVVVSEETTVTDGTGRTNTTLNVTEAIDDVSEIEGGLGGIGSRSTELSLETTYESDAEGDTTYEGTLSATAPLELGSNAYWLEEELSDSATESQIGESETRELPPDMTVVYGLGVLGVLLIFSGSGLALWQVRTDDIQEIERDIVHSKYDEWISSGEFPTDSEKQYIYINSLEDLVDVAIDTNKRVIYDPDLETYSVVDGDLIYYHASDPTQIDTWIDLSTDGN